MKYKVYFTDRQRIMNTKSHTRTRTDMENSYHACNGARSREMGINDPIFMLRMYINQVRDGMIIVTHED